MTTLHVIAMSILCQICPIDAQYADYQAYDKETWNAFIRRITSIKEFKRNGVSTIIIDHDKKEYLL